MCLQAFETKGTSFSLSYELHSSELATGENLKILALFPTMTH